MSNPLFNALGGGSNPIQSLMSQINQIRNNPMQFFASKRLNVPENISNDPQAIVQHLLNTGQMTQAQYNKLQSQINQIMNTNH